MSFGFGVGDFIAVFDKAKKYRDRYKDAPDHLDSLGREVTALYKVLHGINNIRTHLGDYEKEALKAPVIECNKLLDEIESISDANGHSDQDSKLTWFRRIRVNPQELQQLRSRISLNVQLLTVIEQFGDRQVTVDTNRHVKSLHDEQKNQQEQKILEWLDPNSYEPFYQYHLSKRQGHSGHWFLQCEEFNSWVFTKGQGLLCFGIPGSGKTVMSSIVIDHLSCQFQDDENTTTAYIFCNAQNQEEGTFHHYISNLAKQLAQRRFPASLKALYEKHRNKGSSRHGDDTKKLLSELATTPNRRLFIIIDGLDECSEPVRKDLVTYLSRLQLESSANVLMTTRPIAEILNFCNAKLGQCRLLEIRARGDDIRGYVSSRIPLDNDRFRDPALQKEIQDTILRRADGVFLLAKLMMDSVMAEILPKHMLKALEFAPQEYSDYYQRTWDRIKCQKRGHADLGTKVISWVVCAKRPLRLAELQHALAVDDEPQIDEQNIYSKEDILSACLGLVLIDAKSILYLVHQTAVEYFEGEKDKDNFFPQANAEITTVCVRYLSFNQTQQLAAQCNYEMDEKTPCPRAPFCHYAAVHWGNHARDSQQLSQGIQQFLDDTAALEVSWKILKIENRPRRSWQEVPCKRAHIAACFGIRHVFEDKFLPAEETIACEGEPRQLPLNFAVLEGHVELVELLLHSPLLLAQLRMPDSSQAESSSSRRSTPHSQSFRIAILKTVQSGPAAMVDVLIRFCAQHQIHAELPSSRTEPLLNQAAYKDLSIYKALFGRHKNEKGFTKANMSAIGLQVDAESAGSRTPLIDAVIYGNHTAVELLLGIGANIEAQWARGQTPLCEAAIHGSSEQIARLLVGHRANLDVRAGGRSLISLAAGHSEDSAVLSYLIDTLGQNPNAKDDDGRLPIEGALDTLGTTYSQGQPKENVVKGREEIVKVLLKNLDIADRQKFYRTVLELARDCKRSNLLHFVATRPDLDKNMITDVEILSETLQRGKVMGKWHYWKQR